MDSRAAIPIFLRGRAPRTGLGGVLMVQNIVVHLFDLEFDKIELLILKLALLVLLIIKLGKIIKSELKF